MNSKTTLAKTGTHRVFKKWKFSWYAINRGRDAKSYRWIRSFSFSIDLSKTTGYTTRLDLLKKYHVEICLRSNK